MTENTITSINYKTVTELLRLYPLEEEIKNPSQQSIHYFKRCI